MPIYEYQCTACGHELDALQKVNDLALTDCPVCNQASLAKQISAPRFRLKGSGWYETDFKTGNKKNLAGDAGETKPKTDAEKKPDKEAPAAKKSADKPSAGGDSKTA